MDFDLQGSTKKGNFYSIIDVQMVACGSRYTMFDGSELGADENCVWDKQEFLTYLGNSFYIKVYHNQQEFKQDAYGEDRIVRKA